MSSQLRVDNIFPSVGTGIGIGTDNGSITFNAEVTGGMNFTSGSVGIGTDNPSQLLDIQSNTIPTVYLRNRTTTSYARVLLNEVGDTGGGFTINRLGSTSTAIGGARAGQIWNHANAPIVFGTNDTEAARFNTSGNLAFVSGKGIDFSATSDAGGMTSELLDDYEEGTWTPGFQLSSQSGSFTFTGNNGARYTKIGRVVHVNGIIEWSNHNLTAGTVLQVTGLPFTSASSNPDRSGISISYANNAYTGITVYQQALRSETNATYMTFNYSNATDGSIDNVPSYNHISTSGTFIFFGMYIV